MNIVFNADDLGFSRGVNKGIDIAVSRGVLNSASLMANGRYYDEAIEQVRKFNGKLNIGVHIVLTTGKSLTSPKSITEDGVFTKTFIQILFMFKSKHILKEIEKEIEAQILKVKNSGVKICHIDGHEHIHTIPSVKKIIIKLAKKYSIPRIREINEKPVRVFKSSIRKIQPINYIKFFLIRFLYFFQQRTNNVTFYSILQTGNIHHLNLSNYLENNLKEGELLEVMLHPSVCELDIDEKFDNQRTKDFLLSEKRMMELDTCLKKYD